MTQHPETPWMTRAEAAAYLRVSLRTLDRLRAQGKIKSYPAFGTDTSIRFHRDELAQAIRDQQKGES